MSTFDELYDVRTFDPVLVDGVPDAATAAWLGAARIAFHQNDSAAAILQDALGAAADGRGFLGIYAKHSLPGSLDENWPVGTYAGYTKTMNVGGGALVNSYLISDVTVRPTHKRRGLLRHMMTDRLHHAADTGHALAALTASESTIYRRFGFGPAVRTREVLLRRDRPFALHTDPAGRVELVAARSLGDIARKVFADYHARTPGSIDRQQQLWNFRLGLADGEGKPDETLRGAVHYADDNVTIDGYLTYRVVKDGTEIVLEVVDLVAGTANALLGLWGFLGQVDLVDKVKSRASAVDNAVLQALVDSRALLTEGETDHLWIRVLEPIAALSARPYSVDGHLTLRVHDKLGFADGVFAIESAGGAAHVTRAASSDSAVADLELDAATLASLYLGGVSVGVLAEVGLVTEHTAGAVARATALFTPDRPVDCITDF
ncbi:MAG: hypothetical protein JWP75_611 [Frondihabitans sp.]|nr:hypothetical protein [Frondihabitans sp.]